MTSVFTLKVLSGPAQLLWHDERVRLRPMERTFLLALVTARDFTMSAPKLTRQLWHDRPSRSAACTTRSHASHIRSAAEAAAGAPGKALLITDRVRGAGSYQLALEPDRVDAVRLEQLMICGSRKLRYGSTEQAAGDLEAALDLWGGAPLADAAEWDFGKREIARLTGIYRDCVVWLAEIRMEQRRHQEIIGPLAELASGRPDDLRVRELLVTALYRSGRDGDAVRACKNAIKAFIETGLPTSGLNQLLQHALNGDLPR